MNIYQVFRSLWSQFVPLYGVNMLVGAPIPLSQHEEKNEGPSNFIANSCKMGVELSWVTHHTLGSMTPHHSRNHLPNSSNVTENLQILY